MPDDKSFDPLKAYKKSLYNKEASKKYEEGWDRIFGKKEDNKKEANIS